METCVQRPLLSRRKPEALIILAHYAVLLHRRRRVWLVGNVGWILIQEISKFLGTFWKTWLDWPNEVIAPHQGDTYSSQPSEIRRIG
jgi:hypothetical protein